MSLAAGYAQVPPPLNLAAQRHSDPGLAAPPDMLEPADVTLSGDLERLSQHLQSARAMYDSNPGSSAGAARGEAPGAAGQRYGDGSAYRQSYAQQQQQQQQQGGSSFSPLTHNGLPELLMVPSFCRLNALRLTPHLANGGQLLYRLDCYLQGSTIEPPLDRRRRATSTRCGRRRSPTGSSGQLWQLWPGRMPAAGQVCLRTSTSTPQATQGKGQPTAQAQSQGRPHANLQVLRALTYKTAEQQWKMSSVMCCWLNLWFPTESGGRTELCKNTPVSV